MIEWYFIFTTIIDYIYYYYWFENNTPNSDLKYW